jgi:hypothetical protein
MTTFADLPGKSGSWHAKRGPNVREFGWTRRPIEAPELTREQAQELHEYNAAVAWATRAMGLAQ